MLIFKLQPGLLKDTLLAGGLNLDQHIADGQDGGETIHLITAASSAGAWLILPDSLTAPTGSLGADVLMDACDIV